MKILSQLENSKDEVCPYCRSVIPKDESVACVLCHTHHHIDCWNEAGGCSVYGCREGEFTPNIVWLLKCLAISIVVVLSSELLTKFWNGRKLGLFGFTFLLSYIFFILTAGYAYGGRGWGLVIRRKDPLLYWTIVFFYAFLALMFLMIMRY